MKTARVSVIIPVYNAEAYIAQAMESVLNQSYQNIELIIINDGSTDGSLKKCLFWKNDPRVTIISTENRGVSSARNLGLEKATGDWVMFLDSDDYFLGNCLEDLMGMVSSDTQIIMASYTDEAANIPMPVHTSVNADSVRRMTLDPINHPCVPAFYKIKPMSFASCCTKLYSNRVIQNHHIRFDEKLRLSEDTLFNLDYLSCIQQVAITNLPLIYYRNNTSSVTKVFHAGYLPDRFRFFDILKERDGTHAAVHIFSLLLFDICKAERYAKAHERKQLELKITHYLSENQDLLRCAVAHTLSTGKWQRIAFHAAAVCFLLRLYWLGFGLLRVYSHISKGDINQISKLT